MADSRTAFPGSHLARWLFCVLALWLAGCTEQDGAVQLSGASMGTTWHVTYLPDPATTDPDQVLAALEAELAAVDASMSTWREDSELSRFNRTPVGEWFSASPALLQVIERALAIGEASSGAYDVSVGPLVQLWGFGSRQRSPGVPGPGELAAARERVGQEWLELDVDNGRLRKQRDLELDLSSIAKGYGVDRLAAELADQGVGDYLVEVGGEMRLAGQSPRGDQWRIAVERPAPGRPTSAGTVPGAQGVALGLALSDIAVATSGDYRNFFKLEGRRYSHTLDPRTGYPVEHDLVSVTVLAKSCMDADAWATALVVLGAEEALALAERRGLAVYLIQRQGEALVTRHSSAFAPWLAQSPAPA